MECSIVEGASPRETKALYQKAMKGEWSEVVDRCREDPILLLAGGITRTNDTLLQLAVYAGEEKTVLEITEIISELPGLINSKDFVGRRNDRGNTALHLAAMLGNVAMCKCIAGIDSSLIIARNHKGETPPLLAVLFGMIVDEQDAKQLDDDPIERKYYKACINFFLLVFRNLVGFVPGPIRYCEDDVTGRTDDESRERQLENPELHNGAWKHRFSTAIYGLFYKIFKLANRTMVIALIVLGISTIRKIYEEKKKHKLSILIMNELLGGSVDYEYYGKPLRQSDTVDAIGPEDKADAYLDEDDTSTETPILIAAANGISEIVEKILELCPIAIHDVNKDNKNAMLLAVQNRQPHVFQILLKKNIIIRDGVMLRVEDTSGNNAAHLAAVLGAYRPWLIPGEALQMQWEMKWFEFVKQSIPPKILTRRNNKGQTPEELFIENHEELVKEGGKWLIKTSESYSLVAVLIATVAFASSTAVPGGVKQDNGIPTLANRAPFHLFAISSLIALCFSVTALVTFLSIVTSRYRERDFGKDLPMKLLIGLTSLFFSIAAVLVTFCSGHFFVLDEKLKNVAYPVYAATFLPVTYFAVMQFPLYFGLLQSTFKKVPRRSYQASVLT